MADEITPPPASVTQPVPRTPSIAIWSLVLAVLSFTCGWLFTAIPAVICGHIARSKIRKSGGALRGKGIATAGLILGYIALALGIMGIPLLVSMIQSDRERLHRLSTERKEIASDDGKIDVIVPGLWVKMPGLNKFATANLSSGGQATLQVGDKSKQMYLIVITDGHPALQDELSGTEKGTKRCFSSYYRGRRRSFSTPNALARECFRSSGDSEVPLATRERTTPRNYPDFSQREIDRHSDR